MSSCGLQTGLRLFRSLQFCFLSHIVQSGLSILAATGVFLMGSWVLFPANAAAQAVYGSIGGTVVDASGGAVADAKVTITDTGRNVVYTTTTTSAGAFT